MSLKALNNLAILLVIENIIVQTLIWGTDEYPRGPESHFEWFISLVSISILVIVVYFLIIKQQHYRNKIKS